MRRTITRPADLDVVRASYDRVADRYVAMGAGELDGHPWLRAAMAAFAETATALALQESSLGGVLGWWSLFDLP